MLRTVVATAVIAAFSTVATAGMIVDGNGVTWAYPDSVAPNAPIQITVTGPAANTIPGDGVAFLQTTSLSGPALTLTQVASVFTTPQLGPGASVGEFTTSNNIDGDFAPTFGPNVEIITATAPGEAGVLNFNGQSQKVGLQALNSPFSIVVTPEPASLALLGLGGLMVVRRRK